MKYCIALFMVFVLGGIFGSVKNEKMSAIPSNFITDFPIEPYFSPHGACAIISTWYAMAKSGKQISILEIKKQFEQYIDAQHSFLDIVSVLEYYGIFAVGYKYSDSNIPKCEDCCYILHLEINKNGITYQHFSCAFVGKDKRIWVVDPLFGTKCLRLEDLIQGNVVFTGKALKIYRN